MTPLTSNLGVDPITRIEAICGDGEGNKLTRIAAVLDGTADETPAEPDAWMSAERDRVMTAETKRSFTKAATAGYTIPLYAHPALPPKTSGEPT